MEITESWRWSIPDAISKRYEIAETRNAAAIMKATTPDALDDIIRVLDGFYLSLDKLTTPGKSKSVVAQELDNAFRASGWREARYEQELTTTLTISPWKKSVAPEQKHKLTSSNSYTGHKIDNVLGRAALEVEWNPKDGNLDRDLANFVSLHEGGVIDVGVIVTRVGAPLRDLVKGLIAQTRNITVPNSYDGWRKRMEELAEDPLRTSTTANFDQLKPRLKRGDGRGCPILAIGITERAYVPPIDSVSDEVLRLAQKVQDGILPIHI